MNQRITLEQGFTLIELLVVIAIISILSGISIQNYSEYRQRIYDSSADHLLHNAKVALEAGKTDIDNLGNDWFWAWSDNMGVINGWRVNEFLPGMKVERQARIWVSYDGWCENSWAGDWCQLHSIQAYHCKGKVVKQWSQWKSGLVWETEWANWGC
ncbi:prepilin-type N-terminal cleavage/methylation domain-containing protein [Oligoflexia bacterium]|nr:prepilin-type N-terminal cleavage/methylation domain-containing protein [Oligoflexia bacterium]